MGLFVFKRRSWGEDASALHKYLIARAVQMMDFGEGLSFRAPYSNGYILLDEIKHAAESTIHSKKSGRRLRSLIEEGLCKDIPTSVVNDVIIKEHYPAIIERLSGYSINGSDESIQELAKKIGKEISVYNERLKAEYAKKIYQGLSDLDLESNQFDRVANRIDELLRCLVPLLFYEGHSPGYLMGSYIRLSRVPTRKLVQRISSIHTISDRPHQYWIDYPIPQDVAVALDATPMTVPRESITDYRGRSASVRIPGHQLNVSGKDAFSSFVKKLDQTFRTVSLQNGEIDFKLIEDIVKNAYTISGRRVSILNPEHNRDPLFTHSRPNTLMTTLEKVGHPLTDFNLKTLEMLQESLYLYNLSHLVPSIESSYTILWTALESLIGSRGSQADIVWIQDNIAPALALGSVGRRANAFARRFKTAYYRYNWNDVGLIEESSYSKEGLTQWILWLADQTVKNTNADPFNTLVEEPHLCRSYCKTNEDWATVSGLLSQIKTSETSLRFHLDRLYLTRNSIVHSGRLGRYTNTLWFHLEWIVGKVLAQGFLILSQLNHSTTSDPRDIIFLDIQDQYRNCISKLETTKSRPIDKRTIETSGIMNYTGLTN